MKRLITLVLILILCGTIKAADVSDNVKPAQWPAMMDGNVVDLTGKGIANATVTLTLEKIHEFDLGRWDEPLISRTVTTNESGEFRIKTGDFAPLKHRPFVTMVDVKANGYADGKWWSWYNHRSERTKENKHLGVIKLSPGRVVTGRCVAPDGSPVAQAVIRTASSHFLARPKIHVGWKPTRSDENGQFQLRVPDDAKRKINIWICHPEWAPKNVSVPLNDDDFPEITLEEGGMIRGQLLGVDGKPAEGVVIKARSLFSGTVDNLSFPVSLGVKTNQNGRYLLPPLLGEYQISITRATRNDLDAITPFTVSDADPPLVIPELIDIGANEQRVLNFRASEPVKVSGMIHWLDGSPAPNCEVRSYYLPEQFRTGVEMITTRTDKNGHYVVDVPRGIPEISLACYGTRNAEGKHHYAHPVETIEAIRKQTQNITIGNLDQDRDGINWVLRVEY